MRGQRSLVGAVLVVVAVWLGASLAALLTGTEQDAAMGLGVALAGAVLLAMAWRGARAARRADTTYW